MARTWTCQAVRGGVRCGHVNPRTRTYCGAPGCTGRKRASRSTADAAVALRDVSYAEAVRINGGEHCGICGRTPPDEVPRLVRDHDHATRECRGVLCDYDNRLLNARLTLTWMRRALPYLERHEARRAGSGAMVGGVPEREGEAKVMDG